MNAQVQMPPAIPTHSHPADVVLPPQSSMAGKRAKFELEAELRLILEQIEDDKRKQFALHKIIHLTGMEFWEDVKNHPWSTALKVSVIAVIGLALHPLIIGAIACAESYRIEDYHDLYSSNITTVSNAFQYYSNVGHAVGYIMEGLELLAFGSALLFWKSYKKASCRIIEAAYDGHVNNASLSKEERDFLYKRKKQELAYYGQMISARAAPPKANAKSVSNSQSPLEIV